MAVGGLWLAAWPAMTPGIFSGQGLPAQAFVMPPEPLRAALPLPSGQAHSRFRLPPALAAYLPVGLEAQLAAVEPLIVELDALLRPPLVLLAKHPPTPPPRKPHRFHDVLFIVPEPSVWVLMIVGLGGVGAALRRRRAAAGVNSPRILRRD